MGHPLNRNSLIGQGGPYPPPHMGESTQNPKKRICFPIRCDKTVSGILKRQLNNSGEHFHFLALESNSEPETPITVNFPYKTSAPTALTGDFRPKIDLKAIFSDPKCRENTQEH